MSTPTLREALAELVALREMEEAIEKGPHPRAIEANLFQRLKEDYAHRKPLAWAAARLALTAPEQSPADGGQAVAWQECPVDRERFRELARQAGFQPGVGGYIWAGDEIPQAEVSDALWDFTKLLKAEYATPAAPHQQAAQPEKLAPAPQQAGQENDEFETRADGKRVRKDRWQWGIRRIVALLWGNRHEFEVDEVVEAVRKLLPTPFANGEDEALVDSVGRGFTPPSPQQAAQGGERDNSLEAQIVRIAHQATTEVVNYGNSPEVFRQAIWAGINAARAAQGERAGVGLTRQQVKEIIRSAGYTTAPAQSRADFINGIRHCERAHGIGTTEGGGE